jgi:hypothetical protein
MEGLRLRSEDVEINSLKVKSSRLKAESWKLES